MALLPRPLKLVQAIAFWLLDRKLRDSGALTHTSSARGVASEVKTGVGESSASKLHKYIGIPLSSCKEHTHDHTLQSSNR